MERPFVMHLYGHSHVRRFMEFLDDKPGYTFEGLPQLSEANSLRKKKDPSAETLLPNMGFSTGRFRFMADQGSSLPQIKDSLLRYKGNPRDLQLIYAGDNDRWSCPNPIVAAGRIFSTILEFVPVATGPTIVAGLLPRWKMPEYCKWAGQVNEELVRLIREENTKAGRVRIIWLQHQKEMALVDVPTNPGVYDREEIHGNLRSWWPKGNIWRRDDVHLCPLANAKFYFNLRHAIQYALTLMQ